MENEFDFVLVAYLVALTPVLYMFFTSRKKYHILRREVAKAKVAKPQASKKSKKKN